MRKKQFLNVKNNLLELEKKNKELEDIEGERQSSKNFKNDRITIFQTDYCIKYLYF